MTDLFDPTDLDNSNSQPKEIKADDLVGEGKKFKTVDDLAFGKYQADTFIEQLKRENQELRSEIASRKRLEDLAELFTTRKPDSTVDNQTDEKPGEQNKPAFDPEEISKLVEDTVSRREAARRQEANLKEVKQTLMDHFGPEYPKHLTAQADALGMDPKELSQLAAVNPKALYRLVGLDNTKAPNPAADLFAPPKSQMAVPPRQNTGERTKSYYDKMRREDPKEYMSSRIQTQMHNDAIRLGERFFQ
jgi:hypothetical protein